MGVELDRVEGVAARLEADARGYLAVARRLQRQAQGQGLGDRLDGEGLLGIAHGMKPAHER